MQTLLVIFLQSLSLSFQGVLGTAELGAQSLVMQVEIICYMVSFI